jgi:hypothetical protein
MLYTNPTAFSGIFSITLFLYVHIQCLFNYLYNAILGKVENALKKSGFDLPTFLRNAAEYFEAGAYVDKSGNMYIHPTEIPQPKKLSKKNYNRCKKLYDNEMFIPKRKNQKKKPFPEYPKSGKPTKALKDLFERFEINLYN